MPAPRALLFDPLHLDWSVRAATHITQPMNRLPRAFTERKRARFVQHVVALTLLLELAVLRFAQAQYARAPLGRRSAAIVADAEADGAAFHARRGRATTARCTEGHETGPAESGEFTIGGMLGDGNPLHAGRVGKIWWRPARASATMPPLTVRGRNLSNLRDTVRFATSTIAWPVVRTGQTTPVERREYFFPSGFSVPTPGRWLVIATSGDNWGCFIVTAV